MQDYMIIHEKDNVAVALKDLRAGYNLVLRGAPVLLKGDIPAGHKFAPDDIKNGDKVIKYGLPIGYATAKIAAGSHVHTDNLRTGLRDILEYSYEPELTGPGAEKEAFFYGYRRKNGKVGVRNQIWILPTVGCVNSVAATLERLAGDLADQEVDGIYAFPHPYGCSQMGDDQENTLKLLANLADHPNAAGVLVLGLGCENCILIN